VKLSSSEPRWALELAPSGLWNGDGISNDKPGPPSPRLTPLSL
jgi:hypothetical protein